MPLSLTSPPTKDPDKLTLSHSTQNSNSTTKKKKRRAKESHLQITFEDPNISNVSHNQYTKSYYNNYNSDFDGKEVVNIDIKDDEGYDSEASKIPSLHKDSITNFDGDSYNIPSLPTKKKKKKNKSALSISQMVDIHHPHYNYNHKSRKDKYDKKEDNNEYDDEDNDNEDEDYEGRKHSSNTQKELLILVVV
ncbi:hypothetical protein F8M41_012825 [Gigaspora margarita]|uniref:Uncharacterized protein n=1 Tax=Gigaspora margarita TaxID=4874 RepID=A0A8H3WYF8_GIGMA|nr:hypothetical protein F8M41_012825 [Gigaspora margarita]